MDTDPDDAGDDWAPLPPEQQAARPGELDAAPGGRAPGRRAAELLAPRGHERAAPDAADDQASRALRALRSKLSDGAGSSLVAGMQRRERRARWLRARADAVAADLESQFVRRTDAATDAPSAPAFEVDPASDMDPRELSGWFRELPPVEQRRLREVWSAARRRFDGAGSAARARRLRAAGQGAAMFVANALLLVLVGLDPWRVLYYAPVGAAAGLLGLALGGERFHFMAAGALAFLLLEGAGLTANPFLLYGMLFAISTMGLVGMDREMRSAAGERDV